MNRLLPILHRQFPEFDPIKVCETAIPVYLVRVTIDVLEPQQLSTFATYFLHAVGLGVNTWSAVAQLLGVDRRDLIPAGIELLKYGFIDQGTPSLNTDRPIFVTDAGKIAISNQRVPPVPKRKSFRLHFNSLTAHLTLVDETAWRNEQMCKEPLFILPSMAEQPTIGDLTKDDIAEALRDEPAFADNDIVEVIDVKAIGLQYLPEVTVFMLRHRTTGEERIAAFRHSRYLSGESEALQRMFENGTEVLSSEAESLRPAIMDIPLSLPRPVARIAQILVERTAALTTLETELAAREEDHSATQDQRERDELEARIRQLKEEVRIKREDAECYRAELSKSKVEFLKTEQHRVVLEQALRDAQEEVIIISPWMNRRACDDYLCRLFGDAIQRGVRIRIGYGMGRERNQQDAEINRINVREVQAAIRRNIPRSLDNMLDMRQTGGSHQKILICDRTLGITGSFNWLSYKGLRDEFYRSETSTVFRNAEHVNQLAQIAVETLEGQAQSHHEMRQ